MPDAREKLLLTCAHKKAAPKGGVCSKHIRADDFDTNESPEILIPLSREE